MAQRFPTTVVPAAIPPAARSAAMLAAAMLIAWLSTVTGPPVRAADPAAPTFHVSDRSDQPLLVADKPWEEFFFGWVRVIREEGRWRVWYHCCDLTYESDDDGFLCYAESKDGVTWVKPELDRVEYRGSRKNNILLDAKEVGGLQGHDIVLDPEAPPAERYKLVVIGLSPNKEDFWIRAMTSADGFSFKPLPDPIFRFNSDTQNTLLRTKDGWRMYVRMWDPRLWTGERVVGLTESKDLASFPAPRIIFRRDERDPTELQFYNPAVTQLDDRLFVMMPSAFMTKQNIVEPHLAWSRDGERFERVGRRPFLPLRPGKFDAKSIYVGPGAVPGPRPGTWWFFYTGIVNGHDNPGKEKWTRQGAMGRFLLEVRDPTTGTGGAKAQ
jgi:hypothetical protein